VISKGESTIEYNPRKNEYVSFDGSVSVSFTPDRGTGPGEMLYDAIAEGVSRTSIRGKQTLRVGKDRIRCAVVDVEYSTNQPAANYSFWIAKTGLVFRRAVTFWDGKEIRTLVSSVRALTANQSLPDETFEFQPPPGVKRVPAPAGPTIQARR